ncbi:MAG TPA: ATP synthase F1 subunit delta [Gemmatimonadales bacterium]
MRAESIARNYAEALFMLGEKSGRTGEYADLLDAIAGAITTSPEVAAVLLSPKVTKAVKIRLLDEAVSASPQEFRLFLAAVIKRGRQGLLPAMAVEYMSLLDLKLDRVRAGITVAREPDQQLRARIQRTLEERLGKEVVPRWTVDPEILGGVVVRLGDRVLDGSVKRRITRLRRHLVR